MQDIEERLKKLAAKVKAKRDQGLIQSWPEEIKSEALALVEQVGSSKAAKITKLHYPTLLRWQRDFESGSKKLSNEEETSLLDKIQVTHLIVQPQEISCEEKQKIIAIVSKGDVEFKFFCKDTILKISERVIL